jgi:uncharacterized protein YaaQ
MKLIFAIIQDEDVDNLVDALISEDFRVTRIGSTGSFLRMGNSSLMIGGAVLLVHNVERFERIPARATSSPTAGF